MATPYFLERARNPYLKRRTAPSETFSQPMSPAITQPPALEPIEAPRSTGRTLMEEILAKAAVDPIETARSEYESKVPTTTGGRIVEALKTAGLGFLQGAARDPNDPIAAGIGGAATGGIISGVSPKTGRGMRFEALERPQLEARLKRQEERERKQMELEDRQLKVQEMQSRIRASDAQTQRALRPERAVNPFRRVEGGILNTTTGELEPIAETPKPPAPAYRETYTGKLFDISDPAQRAEYDRIQSSGPRDKQGRFISRSDERASAPKSAKPKASPKVVSITKVREYAAAKGISESDAVAEAMRDGYRIAR